MDAEEQRSMLNSWASILIRCFFLTMALLLVWFVFFLMAGDASFYLHSRWFDLDWYAYTVLNYYGMALLKIISFVFFLFPYIAIRLVLRKKP